MKLFNFSRSNRTYLLAAITLILMAVFVARLFYLQVVRYDYYSALALSEQTRKYVLPAVRGEIFVMDGEAPTKLALNETVYTVWADPQVVEDSAAVQVAVQEVAGERTVKNIAKLLEKTETRYQILARGLTSDEASTLKGKKLYGVGFERGERRVYPEQELASQVLGFVNNDGEGQYGVEGKLDEQLRGKDGLLKTVADIRDVPLTIGSDNINIPAQDGQDIVLTIDRNVQAKAEEVLKQGVKNLGAKYGSILVMDPRNGQVIAMANVPTYNPNQLNKISNYEQLDNRIISRPYEPASVIKTLTMAAGVDKNVMTPDSTFTNTDSTVIAGEKIENFTKGQTGEVTMQRALNWSLNTGSVKVAEWLGGGTINRTARDTMYEYFHDKFGLGEKTGIELTGEQQGTVVQPSTREGAEIRYANMTFGQGLAVTPLQVAAAFSAVVNGGKYCTPTVLAGTMENSSFMETDKKQCEQVIKASTSSTMRTMIYDARQAFYGSGDIDGFMVGGKTGTAEVAIDGQYDENSSEGTYIGFGAEKNGIPQYVVLVTFAKQGVKIGGQQAIPTFTTMSNWLLEYLKMTPER
jgi:cell division protein FtsI (penicillin-binding protein 3)